MNVRERQDIRVGYEEMPAVSSEPLTEEDIKKWQKARTIGAVMEIHDTIDSTNNRAKELAKQGVPHGFLVAANRQTSGRGRLGRSFFSPEGMGVYISYVLRLPVPVEKMLLVTPLAAVAVARAIEETADEQVKIKWVNDLFLHDKKVCGILCEASPEICDGRPSYLVLGIGVNVAPVTFPPELKDIATSIGNECKKPVSRNRLIAEISNQLEGLLSRLEPADFMGEYRLRSNVIGRRVRVLSGSVSFEALVRDIDDEGRLVVEKDREVLRLSSGEISIRW